MHFSNCPWETDWSLYAKEAKRQYRYASYTTPKRYSRSQYDNLIDAIARIRYEPSVIKGIIEVESGSIPMQSLPRGNGAHAAHAADSPGSWGERPLGSHGEHYGRHEIYLLAVRKYSGNMTHGPRRIQDGPAAVDATAEFHPTKRHRIMLGMSLRESMGGVSGE
jgi:hypothetical protein